MTSIKFQPVLYVRAKVIPLAGSDGGADPHLAAAEATASFADVNRIWAQAGVQFAFDAEHDLLPVVRDDKLWRQDTDESSAAAFEARTELASKYPDSLVLFVRDGGGRSSGDTAFAVVRADFDPAHVAHEIGHYLHLHRTHGAARAGQAKAGDADGAATAWGLDGSKNEKLSAELSPQQIDRARFALEKGNRYRIVQRRPRPDATVVAVAPPNRPSGSPDGVSFSRRLRPRSGRARAS
ncbi:MAG TPA: hypothetical protein VFS43_05455 [Polyangiaceae bacterium]|nr:hypothetical protein [Polyangiaceae bacterium]